ncbi:unnamed protein product [Rotaria sp. Silwood2]|nr:unnamed protein product [Rotaria sp. Silwood2]
MDLPDEILLIIFKELSTIDVYNLVDINERLNNILYDHEIISHLTLFRYSSNNHIYPFDDKLINLFCLRILPEIYHKIKWLNLEVLSMERILERNYPNLCGIGLYNMDLNTALHLFCGKYSLFHMFKKQILSIIIKIDDKETPLTESVLTKIFSHILLMFTNLSYLKFETCSVYSARISFNGVAQQTIFSSNLLKLIINVNTFNDCLYLLDGRFQNLNKLLQMYDNELVIPLLHRMLHLEKLRLHLTVINKETFIDGNNLKINIINYLLNLKKFIFNLHSFIPVENEYDLPSNENIQQTLKDILNNSAFCCIDYYPHTRMGHCHIYSHLRSNDIKCYYYITNNFTGGIFEYVKKISLFDEYAFEHEFFIRISRSFPLVEKLSLSNTIPQKQKQEEINLSIAEFGHLNQLNLDDVVDDYIEQFLMDKKTYLSNNVLLTVEYPQLARVTYNFKRKSTKTNCTKCGYQYND